MTTTPSPELLHPVRRDRRRHGLALLLATALALLVTGLPAPAASADTAPVSSSLPETVSADPLPTWQVTGVVWSQVVVGTTVYATGAFTKARPPGMWQGGPTEINVGNLIAYDITTGQRIASFNHVLDAQGLAVTASPDGSRVYVGGDFTTVDGASRPHLAAFDTTTGALVPGFAPALNDEVKAITATNDTVYAGGAFTAVGTAKRKYLASFSASNGSPTSWAPTADDGYVWALTMTPGSSPKVVAGGQFSTLNGLAVYGMGALDPTTGASLPWAANATIKDFNRGAIDALTTDGTYIYGGGYAYGTGGAFEGSFSLNPSDGSVRWMVDCLGDTYDVEPVGSVVYTVSHSHNCSDVGAFPDTNPRTRWQHAGAYTSYPTGVNSGPSAYGWNYSGKPAPSMLQWFPNLGIGTATGQYQAAWNVASGSGYIALGGEFPTVEGKAQQGLTRYALKTGATNKVGPKYDDTVPIRSAAPRTNAVATSPGTVRVGFGAAWDEDNQRLTYQVYRDRGTPAETLVKTFTLDTTFWSLPTQAVTDSNVPAGDHTYQVRITDPFGNELLSPVSPVVNAATVLPAYASQVLTDGADHYWRLGETGTSVTDTVGEADGTAGTGVTRGTAGALTGDADKASTFSGATTSSVGLGTGPAKAPDTFSVEGWFKTTSTKGGKVVGFGSSRTGSSTSYDRQVYLGPTGKVSFGVSATKAVTSPTAYNDGQWHQAVASLGADGATLWLDGRLVARDRSMTTAASYTGFWRIGGDAQATTWPNAPTTGYLAGSVDDVATYPVVLTQAQVVDHFTKSGRTSTAVSTAPTDGYGASVYNGAPDLYWRLGETAGPLAADRSANDNRGLFLGSPTYAQASALTTSADKSVALSSAGSGVASASSFAAPSSYSQELWFKTTTKTGGKLIGFGSAASGLSPTVDRNLTMTDAGKLRFATLNGTTQVALDTPAAYNDGKWHYVVASQAPQGMKVTVDGVVVASNQTNATTDMVGYWRVGYDKIWSGSTSTTFAGSLDEVAVYPRVLGLSEIKSRFRLGGYSVANTPPAASFTVAQGGLDVAFSGANSSDTDGSITSYAWTFGDGTTATGASPSHTYARAGTYTAVLKVTDDQGASTAVQQTLTVVNGLPTAAFNLASTQRSVSVDGSASKDRDGTIAAWSWSFGDGTSASGATASHVYAADGSYTITLTVTDGAGGTATVSQPVAVAATKPPTAVIGAAPTGTTVAFDGSGSSDPDGRVAAYAWAFGDGTGSADVSPTHTYARPGTYQVTLTVTDDQTATGTTTRTVTVTNAAPKAAFSTTTDALTATFDAGGSSDPDGTVASYAWDFGDGSVSSDAKPSHTYAQPGSYSARLTVTDNLGATGTTTATVTVKAANVRPTASFTSSGSELAVSFDGSASSDPDGTVSSYAWDFGDGTSGSGATATHTYAAVGTYTVTLTVTDDARGTGTATRSVKVDGPLVSDRFGRTGSSGWGTADVGGTWTYNGSTNLFATTGSAATIKMATAGSGPSARLPISSTDTDLRLDFSFDKAPTGGGQFVRGIARGDQSTGYGAKVWVNANGTMYLYLTKIVGGTETDLSGPKALSGTFVPGTSYSLRVQAWGTGTTNLTAKAWPTSGSEPAWQLTTTDSTSGLQSAGGVAVRAYLSGSATAASLPLLLTVDNVVARPTGN